MGGVVVGFFTSLGLGLGLVLGGQGLGLGLDNKTVAYFFILTSSIRARLHLDSRLI